MTEAIFRSPKQLRKLGAQVKSRAQQCDNYGMYKRETEISVRLFEKATRLEKVLDNSMKGLESEI